MNRLLVTIGAILTMALVQVQAGDDGLGTFNDYTNKAVTQYFAKAINKYKLSLYSQANIYSAGLKRKNTVMHFLRSKKIPRPLAAALSQKYYLLFVVIAVGHADIEFKKGGYEAVDKAFNDDWEKTNVKLTQQTTYLFGILLKKFNNQGKK